MEATNPEKTVSVTDVTHAQRTTSVMPEHRSTNYTALRNIVSETFSSYEADCWSALFTGLQESGDSLGFKDAPAGKGQHHAYKGGLVVHLLEMIEMAPEVIKLVNATCTKTVCSRVSQSEYEADSLYALTFEDVLRVVLLHDLHKAHNTFYEKPDGSLDYIRNNESDMMSANAQSLALSSSFGLNYASRLSVMNALESSEGGWAKVHPRFCTPLAKVCYLLDELSANVVAKQVEGNVHPKAVGRSIYLW